MLAGPDAPAGDREHRPTRQVSCNYGDRREALLDPRGFDHGRVQFNEPLALSNEHNWRQGGPLPSVIGQPQPEAGRRGLCAGGFGEVDEHLTQIFRFHGGLSDFIERQGVLEARGFAFQAAAAGGLLQGSVHFSQAEGLEDVVAGVVAHRGDDALDRWKAGHHHHTEVRFALFEVGYQVHPFGLALHAHVGEHHVDRFITEDTLGGAPIGAFPDLMAQGGEVLDKKLTDLGLIVNNQDVQPLGVHQDLFTVYTVQDATLSHGSGGIALAKVIKEDLTLRKRLEELDRRLTVLKIQYDKYFSGLERIEPLREREELRRMFRDLMTENISNSRQRFLFQNLRARYNTMEMYFTRNLVMIERGTHPKMQFRAAMRDRQKREAEARIASNRARQRNEEDDRRQREDRAYSQVFERYIAARKQCGQSTDLDFEAVKKTLKNQVRMIKSRYRCESVKFRITVEEGKARLKAIPKRS